MTMIWEPARQIPVWDEADVCVVGGSCTGVFAAIRAARMGLKVALVENQGRLGGTATAGLVYIWHTLLDDTFTVPVIGGLTDEVERRLYKAGRLEYAGHSHGAGARLDPLYLAYTLDQMAREEGLRIYLHTRYAALQRDGERVTAVILENKDGRGAIRARFFIDATGDGDLCRDIGLPCYRNENIQPPSACFYMTGGTDDEHLERMVLEHGAEFGLDNDTGWNGPLPNTENVYFRADNHVFGVDCSKAADLTRAEVEGRRRAFAFEAMTNAYGKRAHRIVNLCSHIGVRDTRHYETDYRATEMDLLSGRDFEDAILHGTYRLDVHHQQDNMGWTFKYLDGRVETYLGKSPVPIVSNWREEMGLGPAERHYYSLPFRTLVQRQSANFIMAGRMVNAEEFAFGALRVMVNCNQMGEAAGVAAALCLRNDQPVWALDGRDVRAALNAGGSLL